MPPRQTPPPTEPQSPPLPASPSPPPTQQHVHFVLHVEALLKKRGAHVPPPPPIPPTPPLAPFATHPNPAHARTSALKAHSSTPKSRPTSAAPERAHAPPTITEVDPNSLHLKLQFRPWVEYDQHQEMHFPSSVLEQQRKGAGKNVVPEHDIVLQPVPLSFSPEAAAVVEQARAVDEAVARAATEVAAGLQDGGVPPSPSMASSRKGTPKAGTRSVIHQTPTPPTPPEPLVWDGTGEEPTRGWYHEHHFMVNVDEQFVREMARDQANLVLVLELSQPQPEPPAKASKSQLAVPETPVAGVRSVVSLGCGGLLVGDTAAEGLWPSKLQPMPSELVGLCDRLQISLQALSPPIKPLEEVSAPCTKLTLKNKAPAGKPKDASSEPELSAMSGDPIRLLTPELAMRLNPLVIVPTRANAIPDAPATVAQLDNKCEPIKLRMCWPAKLPPHEQQGRPSPWTQVQPVTRQGPATHQRCIGFGQAHVLLAGDFTADEVLLWCRERPLTIEIHDRTAVPEPPEFPMATPAPPPSTEPPPEAKPEATKPTGKLTRKEQEAAAVAAAAAAAAAEAAALAKAAAEAKEDDGYVCAVARVPLLELMRGGTLLRFAAPLAPHTTIRGAASLDWSKRPGNYSVAGSILKGWVRTAVPIPSMKGMMPLVERLYSRVVFVMDYRDSELFHLLEDTVRRQNAVALGLVELPPPKSAAPPPPPPPPQTVLQKAAANTLGLSGLRNSQTALEEALLAVECAAKAVDATNPFLQEPWQQAAGNDHHTSNARNFSGDGKSNSSQMRPKAHDSSRPGSSKFLHINEAGGDSSNAGAGLPPKNARRRTSENEGYLAGVSIMRRSSNSAALMGGSHPGAGGQHCNDWGGAARGGNATAKTGKPKSRPITSKDKDQKDRKALRFRGFAGAGGGSADSDGSAEDEPILTPAAVELNAQLERLERIPLEMRLLQALSSAKLPPSELPKPVPPTPEKPPTPKVKPVKPGGKHMRPPSPPPAVPLPPPPPPDLLTGFHLVDGVRRIIMLEGLCDGAMRTIRAIIDWCLETLQPEPSWLKRVVLHNSMTRYPIRLWADLGADLHILKLGAPLHKIISDAGSYATGKVRVECIVGLRRLGALASLKPGYCWSRLVEDLQLYPSPNMVHLVDKKFGGELSKADVFGVEVGEFESDEEDGGVMGLVTDEHGSTASSKRSYVRSRKGRSSKSRGRGRGTVTAGSVHGRVHPPLLPLDTRNDAYVALREKARQHRATVNFQELHRQYLDAKAGATAHLRAAWASWNPYRQAARELSQAVEHGVLTLEDTMRSWSLYHTLSSKGKLGPGGNLTENELDPEGVMHNDWVLHPQPFRWPVPKAPTEYASHPHAPSEFRRQQLEEPWEEGSMLIPTTSMDRGPPPGAKDFVTTVLNKDRTGIQDGLFGQDPAFWRTVHESGAIQEQQEAEIREREQMEWTKRLVVDDPTMQTTFPFRKRFTQEDRYSHILQDKPMKKSIRMTYAPQTPISMDSEMPWTGEKTTKLPKIDRSTFVIPGQDFKNALALPKRNVSKLGPGQYQSWTASIHDKVYSQY